MAGDRPGSVDIDSKGIAAVLVSSPMRRAMNVTATIAQVEYVLDVAKQTGELASSARHDVVMDKMVSPRWVAELSVDAPYAVWHEFGAGDGKPHATGNMPWYGPYKGAHDFADVLHAMQGTL